ncbi:unnamed protein product [Arabis nemorensis]|uniref:Receptor-like serine/threonine-protein kinase n=1 Tax=Arabis nemorensis TaxID=586526 RepID=A0A565BZY4_9BRAS|nr:unnamed protein product [Arabis nemorensis]
MSPNKAFEMGLFQASKSGWFLGIWLKEDPSKISLWVANRDLPLKTATVKLICSQENRLLLMGEGNATFSWNMSGMGIKAELMDNGNLVMRDSDKRTTWESFAFPTDTLLPEMNLSIDGTTRVLDSWTSQEDPRKGQFSLGIALHGNEIYEIFVQSSSSDSKSKYGNDVWDGKRFGDMPVILQESQDSFTMKKQKQYTRLTLSSRGYYQIFTWIPRDARWDLAWSVNNSCYLSPCGAYSYCLTDTPPNQDPFCKCVQDFIPVAKGNALPGQGACTRRTNTFNCTGDVFVKMQNMRLPLTLEYSSDESELAFDLQGCEERCRENCDCTAFAFVKTGARIGHCVTWIGVLNDLRKYKIGGHDLYFKLAANDSDVAVATKKPPGGLKAWIIGILVAGGVIVSIALCVFFCLWWKQKKRNQQEAPTETEILMNEITPEDRFEFMDLSTIVEATDNFSSSNELGRGGFGTVYKGILPRGREVAVKRLSTLSSQGLDEFRNEVTTILNVLHRNLVRLVGCCCEGTEKLLVYEYLENSSLNRYIFDELRSSLLNWQNRCQHDRQDFDFGMAAMMERGQTHAQTERVVGTYGYMSEEYALHNVYSEKSDVFSFGVLLLEIITGKRNGDHCRSNPGESLLGLAWKMWNEGEGLDLVDSQFVDSTLVENEVLRCIQIGLWCVQDRVEDRPTMDLVIVMLRSTDEIPRFNEPKYYYARRLGGEIASTSSSLPRETSSVLTSSYNQITLSVLDAR